MKNKSLYTPQLEHDSCGIGFVAHIKGQKSHKIVEDGLTMLANMEHRGGCGCDAESGDGAGILVQTPHEFLKEECAKIGIDLPEFGKYGVGVMFFNASSGLVQATKDRIELHLDQLGFELLGYRKVPVNNEVIGEQAKESELPVEQIFVQLKDNSLSSEELERKLFVLRKLTTHSIGKSAIEVEGNNYEFYWLSLSYKTVVYKGMLRTNQLKDYYPDLQNPTFKSALALVHSRFSTNTVPKWKLAQPFRYIAHNGEINTIRGNVNWMVSKQRLFESKLFTPEEFELLLPICDKAHSDSANLDSIVEMLTLAGRSLPHAMMMVIPEAWQGNEEMDDEKKAFYEYHASLMEPWDGPASISFSDGNVIGATLDRNGLRPSRYLVTKDDVVVMASEAGVLPVDESQILVKGRLQPGKMFVVDLDKGRIISDDELKDELIKSNPYKEWLQAGRIKLADLPVGEVETTPSNIELLKQQVAFGYSQEDLKVVLGPMANSAIEPLGSMGIDIPLPPLSKKFQHLSNFFKQQFAQVSNPPIDPIREKMVMSLYSSLGKTLNALDTTSAHCKQIHLDQPVLSINEIAKLKALPAHGFSSAVLDTTFDKRESIIAVLDNLCKKAEQSIKFGATILILSDKKVSENRVALPSLLALGSVHHYLIKKALRATSSLVVESGDVRETHHFATLIGYGANAVCPYLALATISQLHQEELLAKEISKEKAEENYINAIGYGLRKVFSKMGISTLQSYQGAQIFEIIGLNTEVVERSFRKSVSRIEGLGFSDINKMIIEQHAKAYPSIKVEGKILEEGGVYQWKHEGEKHLFNPETIRLLQQSTRQNDYKIYKEYAQKINEQTKEAITLRGLMGFTNQSPIPLKEVEPAENILKRFATGAMSFGSISYEAHSTLAIAMNRIGAKSNSGEGGEDEARFEKKANGDWERSAIKQVASGRFGVTSYYLTNADEIQIKMAQGAKPGEGGQLPGHKVDDWIGRVRHSTPGVGLISPPPHHDIYSIEDLAQLIYDLKRANREARINVKLVSEAGVGTIASGVAKAKADVVLIAGHDGGTGASPISSIQHAGLPWELGLAEAHQTLLKNKLRNRITVQADGQMRTGKDLAIATLLGAEEWGVATAALVVEGCIMMRKCHLNTCPVGVATQNKDLRKKFTGKADHVVNFFQFLAEDLREIMAELGFRTINEMVGKVDRLKLLDAVKDSPYNNLDFSPILYQQEVDEQDGSFKQKEQDHELSLSLDWQLIKAAKNALSSGKKVEADFNIQSTDRSVGTILSNEISKKYKGEGLPEGTIKFSFKGSAGQSFAAFAAKGLSFSIEGEANDYFGKGLSGAQISVYPSTEAKFIAAENQIIGNVAFYGATSGQAYIAGLAGERFAVRNSGVKTVVEGVGDHGCEYMTGGTVVILGEIGRNFAAGMSGGEAYLYESNSKMLARINREMVDIDPLDSEDEIELKSLIHSHVNATNSVKGKSILDNWATELPKFIKVMPRDYKAVLLKKKAIISP
ncbi:MAG: glutamate synthase large subunit [Cyclobacteriaceae bacterium]|nr:glutamate synthase large subunit [Cyclobacteriaceae bacterium]